MANNIAPEWPVANDALWMCQIVQTTVNVRTGLPEESPVIGRSDVIAFASADEEVDIATAIHADLSLALTNVAGTNTYFGYPQGDKAQLRLLPTHKDLPVFIHFVMGNGDWHEVAQTIVRNKRTATN